MMIKPQMGTVCKPESEHQQSSKNRYKINVDSSLLANISHHFSVLALALSLTVLTCSIFTMPEINWSQFIGFDFAFAMGFDFLRINWGHFFAVEQTSR